MSSRVAIVKSPRRGWGIVYQNGSESFGYASKEHALNVVARCGCAAIDLTETPTPREMQGNIIWAFETVGTLEHWRASVGGKTVATAERRDVEALWDSRIGNEPLPPLASITILARQVIAAEDKKHSNNNNNNR